MTAKLDRKSLERRQAYVSSDNPVERLSRATGADWVHALTDRYVGEPSPEPRS